MVFDYIGENIKIVQDSIENAVLQAGRDIDEVNLIGVSKFYPVEAIKAAYSAGIADFGENRVYELLEKKTILDIENVNPKWHLIGTLQRRKVKDIIGNCDLIHSVDSLELLNEISTVPDKTGHLTSLLLQLNISNEESKHGFEICQVSEIIDVALRLPMIKLCGFMTMAPLTDDIAKIEKVFEDTQKIFNDTKSNLKSDDFNILSMGMSNDYKIAIKYGATHLRIGSAIFASHTN